MVPAWRAGDWRDRSVAFTAAIDAPITVVHDRRERRELWALADPEVNAYVGSAGEVGAPWPHLQQVCLIRRERTLGRASTVAEEYAITSLPPTRADAGRLLDLNRSYWGIENRLHWVRDVTFDEDRSAIRTGAAPQVVAGLRNLAIALLRRRHATNIAAALRTFAARPRQAVALVLAVPK